MLWFAFKGLFSSPLDSLLALRVCLSAGLLRSLWAVTLNMKTVWLHIYPVQNSCSPQSVFLSSLVSTTHWARCGFLLSFPCKSFAYFLESVSLSILLKTWGFFKPLFSPVFLAPSSFSSNFGTQMTLILGFLLFTFIFASQVPVTQLIFVQSAFSLLFRVDEFY